MALIADEVIDKIDTIDAINTIDAIDHLLSVPEDLCLSFLHHNSWKTKYFFVGPLSC